VTGVPEALPDPILLRPAGAALLMGAVVLLIRSHVPVLVSVAVGGVTYLGALLALGVIGKDELRLFREARFPRAKMES